MELRDDDTEFRARRVRQLAFCNGKQTDRSALGRRPWAAQLALKEAGGRQLPSAREARHTGITLVGNLASDR